MSQNQSTPTSKKLDERCFTPVTIHESPVSKTPQRGNLTGNPRKIRDSVADLYNLIQEWNNNHITGSEILSKINFLKCNSMKEDGNIDPKKLYPEGLQELCDELNETCQILREVLRKMSITTTEVAAVVKLEKRRSSSDTPMFLTWPAQRFEEKFSLITSAYEKELSLKTHVKENVAHITTEADLMFYVASWAHQPYIDSNVNITLETLLKETGHS